MKIIFATQTGNSEELAQDLANSLGTECVSMADIDLSDIRGETCLFILSTWGEGEPPDDGEKFLEELLHCKEDLSDISYSICGLGDESYDIFCGFAKDVDKYLSRQKAKQIAENVYCNVEYEEDFKNWASNILSTLNGEKSNKNAPPTSEKNISLLIEDLTLINNRVKEWEWKWPNTQIEALMRALKRKI